MKLLSKTIENIEKISIDADGNIKNRFSKLAIPTGSLGRLEEFATIYASIKGALDATIKDKVVFTMAGDHGVCSEGVSAFPQEVTGQMVKNFLDGGATISVLAKHVGARVVVVDCGVKADFKPVEGLKIKKVGYGTGNIAHGPAMSRNQAIKSLETGIEVFNEELVNGMDIIATGDMGIANTTPSSAIIACLTGADLYKVTGRGTGLDDIGVEKKIKVIKTALDVNKPDPSDPIDVLSKVGGFEIGGIAGLCLAAARHRTPVLIDGFISTAAALIAFSIEPKVNDYLISSHKSTENGHKTALEKLKKRAILDLDLRLGEGTGAVLAMSLIEAGVKSLTQLATFSEAEVSTPCVTK
ncbi:nicotinate-nucleotide-dimethylbenzimidazole phosphoribosyltransferase [Candidatus Scalindua japonica]|uniref:Nicotinate-nucleotide--dimethylbenzimidazole phosphoribosyltransferase n=1 Tax=Candidatus Scalindua japonica TaxID=1284222 RepID=A0A286TY08_9BACT|nr:nicotinate-nucleotide--dimethylbenzimidazole phosphoribosyltransferase [Candidatus Scalindua japonica]GAX60785.1 nicotinate-nucleotide-dimethylbenzimidazole phosphoribosyltransferase [Candidatus Scalindua japonica]